MHYYLTAAMGAFCLMYTIHNMIYMTINKRMVMAYLAVISLGLMKHVKSGLATFFTDT